MNDRVEGIRTRLREALDTDEISVIDESHQHVGHPGARTGLGHFTVIARSPAFTGKSMIERHRLVYGALGEMMQTDIHAVSIRALAPGE